MTDRRVQRSRRALRSAFARLLVSVGYDRMTVEDILAEADVSRGTFYAHYRDKTDLFDQVVDEVVQEVRERVEETAPATSRGFTGEPIRAILTVVSKEPELFKALLQGEGNGRALGRFRSEFARIAEAAMDRRARMFGVAPRLQLDLVAQVWSGEVLAIAAWWLETDRQMELGTLVRALQEYSLHGRFWANGFDSADLATVDADSSQALELEDLSAIDHLR